MLDDEIPRFLKLAVQGLTDMDSIFVVFFLERKLFLNLLTYCRMITESRKVIFLLLVLHRQKYETMKTQSEKFDGSVHNTDVIGTDAGLALN